MYKKGDEVWVFLSANEGTVSGKVRDIQPGYSSFIAGPDTPVTHMLIVDCDDGYTRLMTVPALKVKEES